MREQKTYGVQLMVVANNNAMIAILVGLFMLMTDKTKQIALPLAGHGIIITYALAHIIDIHGTLKLGVGTRTGTKDFKCCPAQRIPAEHSFCNDYICT